MPTLKHAVQRYVGSKRLDNVQLAQLESLLAAESGNSQPQKQAFYWATLAASLVLMFLLSWIMYPQLTRPDMISQIADEVVKNHLKLNPLEVESSQLEEVGRYFTRLDFKVIRSQRLPAIDEQLLGGRYCSLQGITAAQLRLNEDDGNSVKTLYQTYYDPEIFGEDIPSLDKGEEPVITYSRGIKVTIWIEKGVLFAVTEGG